MIDFDGYRPNVGIVICNRKGQVLWAKRYGQNSWQFPQGGINDNESAEQAMYRELYEEVGLQPKDVMCFTRLNIGCVISCRKDCCVMTANPCVLGKNNVGFCCN